MVKAFGPAGPLLALTYWLPTMLPLPLANIQVTESVITGITGITEAPQLLPLMVVLEKEPPPVLVSRLPTLAAGSVPTMYPFPPPGTRYMTGGVVPNNSVKPVR